ncbi:MAG: hypothetical protein ACRDZQ_11445, partial [Acidimicrobiales bacterium]
AKPAPGQGLIAAALAASRRLLVSAEAAVRPVTVLSPGTRAGRVDAPWLSSPVRATTARPVTLVGWPGLTARLSVVPPGHLGKKVPAGTGAGRVVVALGAQKATVDLTTTRAVPAPSLRWRLGRV